VRCLRESSLFDLGGRWVCIAWSFGFERGVLVGCMGIEYREVASRVLLYLRMVLVLMERPGAGRIYLSTLSTCVERWGRLGMPEHFNTHASHSGRRDLHTIEHLCFTSANYTRSHCGRMGMACPSGHPLTESPRGTNMFQYIPNPWDSEDPPRICWAHASLAKPECRVASSQP